MQDSLLLVRLSLVWVILILTSPNLRLLTTQYVRLQDRVYTSYLIFDVCMYTNLVIRVIPVLG